VQQPPHTSAAPGGFGAPSGGTGGNDNDGRNRRRGRGNNSGNSGTSNKGARQPGSRPGTPLAPPGYGYGAGGHGGHGAPGFGYGTSGFGAPWPGWKPGYGVYPPRPRVNQQPQASLHMMVHQGVTSSPLPASATSASLHHHRLYRLGCPCTGPGIPWPVGLGIRRLSPTTSTR
jgi:hypothetical protein